MSASDRITREVAAALAEDIGDGDITAALIEPHTVGKARVVSRDDAVLCGREWFDETLRQVEPAIVCDWSGRDGEAIAAGAVVCRLQGPARGLLTAERTALNFLQLLSGVATTTRAYVEAVAHTRTRILDTRKTIPGLRRSQKYAVVCGGGVNHRIGLFDAFLIKENHIAAAGSMAGAIAAARDLGKGRLVEVEVESLDQLDEALAARPDRVMLDNFTLADLRTAVERSAGRVELEASGGVELATLARIAATGVDFISVGALTKHLRAVDFSMRFDA